MPFELEIPTKARLADIIVLSQKNRQPDENPGAKLSFEVDLTNDALSGFDGALKSFLYTKNGGASKAQQGTLEGVPVVSDMPNLTGIGTKCGVLHWEQELTGYELAIDLGLGGRSNLDIADCVLANFRIIPKEGGTVTVKLDCESQNVSESAFGKLAKLKSREVDIILLAPTVAQQELPDGEKPKGWPFPKDASGESPPQRVTTENVKARKGKDATEAFLDAQGAGAAS